MAAANSSVRVLVTKFQSRPFYFMYYDDPLTGRRITKSTKQTTLKAAEKVAAKWEAELQEGRYKPKVNITWADFREAFLSARDHDCTDKGYSGFVSALNAVERHLKVERVAELTTPRIAYLVKQLRTMDKVSDETIRSYLSHLRAALNWANRQEMLREVPAFDMPKSAKKMKGRPITTEEFERMLGKIEAGLVLANTSRVNPKAKRQPSDDAKANRLKRLAAGAKVAAPSWERFLRGLWLSGLRLSEAVTLSWDDEQCITVDMHGKHPRLVIQAGQDKSQEPRILPLAPEFADMLAALPKDQRTGPVFPLRGIQGERTADLIYISRVVSAIGKAANVVVDKASGKFASAHDLRRAFGERWASLVMPADLMKLMRHADISTTMKFYVGHSIASTEDAIYRAAAAQPQPAKAATA